MSAASMVLDVNCLLDVDFAISYIAKLDLYLASDEFPHTKLEALDYQLAHFLNRYSLFNALAREGRLSRDQNSLGYTELHVIIKSLVQRRAVLLELLRDIRAARWRYEG